MLAAKLHAVGLRATRPRLAVLGYFFETRGHHSADEVVRALADRGDPLPRASVFGIVDALSTAGLLRIADTGPGRALYEWSAEPHHHFVCRRCGAVFDVPCGVGKEPCLSPSPAPGRVESAQVIYRGICAGCGG